MNNPFSSLPKPKKEVEHHYDEWEGVFSCQQSGCNERAGRAKYFPKLKLLAWECPEGHKSTIEGINE